MKKYVRKLKATVVQKRRNYSSRKIGQEINKLPSNIEFIRDQMCGQRKKELQVLHHYLDLRVTNTQDHHEELGTVQYKYKQRKKTGSAKLKQDAVTIVTKKKGIVEKKGRCIRAILKNQYYNFVIITYCKSSFICVWLHLWTSIGQPTVVILIIKVKIQNLTEEGTRTS